MVELFTKFHPFLRPINMGKTWPFIPDEVMARIKKNKRVQRASKKVKLVVLAAPLETTDE
jgi:hypothetical protein